MTRHYTPEQKAARAAWTREWRKRNKARIQAYEATYAPRRTRLARKRRKADPEKFRNQALVRSRRRLAERALYTRQYRARHLASNPDWNRMRMREWARKNPGYWSEVARRRRLRRALQRWASTCAANRTHPQRGGV